MALTICTNSPYCISWYGQELWARIRIAAWNDCSNCSNCFSVWKAIRRSPLATLLKSWSVLKKMPSTTERNTTDARCIRARTGCHPVFGIPSLVAQQSFFQQASDTKANGWRCSNKSQFTPKQTKYSQKNLWQVLIKPFLRLNWLRLRCDGINDELISMRSSPDWRVRRDTGWRANWSGSTHGWFDGNKRGYAEICIHLNVSKLDNFQFS